MLTVKDKKVSKVSIWNKNYILCMIVSTVAGFGHSMFNPALPVYASGLGITTNVIGSIIAFAMFLSMFGRGIVGGFADRTNKKKLVFISLSFMTGGYLCYFFANNVSLILIAKTFQTIGFGMVNTVLSAMAFETVPQEKLASAIGTFSLASSLAQIFAPNIGTNIAYKGKFTLLFSIGIGMSLLSIILLSQIKTKESNLETKVEKKHGFKLGDYICKPAIPAAIMLLFNGIIYSSISNYLSLYGLEKGLNQVGVFFTINAIIMMISRPMVGKICDTKPIGIIIIPGYLAQIGACLLLANAFNMPVIFLAAACYGFGFGSTQAALQIIALRSVGPEERGAANGTYYVGGDIGLSAGTYVAGSLAVSIGYSQMYMVMGVVAMISLLFFMYYK